MSWRTASLLREALLNLRANGARTAFVGLTAAAVFGSLAFLELREADSLRAFERSLIDGGGYVAVASGQGGLPASRCAALNGQPGVVAAGGVRAHGQATFATQPGVLFQSASVTEQTLRAWDPQFHSSSTTGGQLILGEAAAQELGVRDGLTIAEPGEPPASVTVADTSLRNPQAGRWALDVVPATGRVDECWVEFAPATFSAGMDALAAQVTDGSTEAVTRPYLRQGEFARNPAQELHDRPQRLGWAVAAALLVGIFVLAAWFRRGELGLYMALGTPRRALILVFATEAWLLCAVAWALSLLWAAALARLAGYEITASGLRLAAVTSGSCALLTVALAPLLSPLVARGSLAALLKDR